LTTSEDYSAHCVEVSIRSRLFEVVSGEEKRAQILVGNEIRRKNEE